MKNQIIVLGTIHEGHQKFEQYSYSKLDAIIRKIAPDIILGEIPPDRFIDVSNEFQNRGTISDSRMMDLPEYEAVIFPLVAELGIKILPISAWTSELNELRLEQLDTIRNDPAQISTWLSYQEAHDTVTQLLEASGKGYDPLWIDSPDYDNIVKIELDAFNQMFKGEHDYGNLEHINQAHYRLIERALDQLPGNEIRILLTFGMGHKSWMRAQIAKRDDVEQLTLSDLL